MAYGFHNWFVAERTDARVKREETVVGVQAHEVNLQDVIASQGIHKYLLVGEPDAIERAEAELSAAFPHLKVVRSSPILCEIMDGHVSKTVGITCVCKHLNVELIQAMVFGDGRNDIDMLQAVPESWAMANAPLEVREAAAHITRLDNNHDGSANEILTMLKRVQKSESTEK